MYMLRKSLFILILSIAGVALQVNAQKGSAKNCFCTCSCSDRDAYDNEIPYYSEEGVEVQTGDGEMRTVHNFCDKKFYDRAKNGLCSPDEK